MNLFVGHLHYNTKEEELNELFSNYGDVVSVNIIRDHQTNKSKGFAFVEIWDSEDAERAIAELDGYMLRGHQISVSEAKPKA